MVAKAEKVRKEDTEDQGVPPYPGLRYYEDDEALFFAGRKEAAMRCTRRLVQAPVLILHGRSGCGKSSFLRAGVKPKMGEAMPGRTFPENFEVVRCTENPLKAFSDMLIRICGDFVKRQKNSFWKPDKFVEAEDIKEFEKNYRTRIEEMPTSAEMICETLEELCGLLRSVPVFVIDQAEEVFTHEEKRKRGLAKLVKLDADEDEQRGKGETEKDDKAAAEEEKQRKTLEREMRELEDATDEFFKLLTSFASGRAGGAKLVISLRTEYKGQFDDKIKHSEKTTDKIEGFYLEDLDVKGLKAAIERPTLKASEWKKITEAEDEPAPFDTWRFEFGKGVAEDLAKKLIDTDKVPDGGVLPTLQIACRRLWDQASRSKRSRSGTFTIEDRHLKRIGQIDKQVQEYVSEKLEIACQEVGKWPEGAADAVEEWQKILTKKLVEVQADGRAVSLTIPCKELAEDAMEQFGFKLDDAAGRKKIDTVIEYLRRSDVAVLNDSRKDGTIALGHDSVALSLNKWSIRYNHEDRMMMRMKMTGDKAPHDFTTTDLFPMVKPAGKRRAVRDEPHRTKIVIHNDPHWDRQFPHFADKMGFAERLGIDFVTDKNHLDLTAKGAKGAPKNWEELSKNLRKEEQDAHEIRTADSGKENLRVMVAADWHSFPRIGTEGQEKDDKALKRKNDGIVPRWTDIVVTNLFTGNALIGQHLPGFQAVDDDFTLGASHPGERYLPIMKANLELLHKHEGEVRCHDNLAREFLIKSAEFACGKRSKVTKYLKEEENVSIFVPDRKDDSPYPLADWFIGDNGTEADRPRFIVGTAATRALALQADGHLYFATSQLTLVARWLINQRSAKSGENITQDEEDLNSEVQSVIKHTSWQLGIAPAQWNQGRNRALVLRLASIGYYVAEYYRSHADDFVRFIRDRIHDHLKTQEGKSDLRGARMNRDAIRNAVRDCYSIHRFDEIGTEFYDLDSTVAYLTKHAEYESLSAAGEIYRELAALRQQTLSQYESVSRMIFWLRKRGYYRLSDAVTQQVTQLKKCAWNNYRIFNFFDSARFMTEAAVLLQREMESVRYGDAANE